MLGRRLLSKAPFSLPNSSVRSRWMASFYAPPTTISKAEDRRQLNDFFPTFLDAAMDSLRPFRVPSQSEWIEKMLRWNVDRVRYPGSIILLNAVRELSGGPDAPPDVMRKAKYLAWCNELMCACLIMVDDIIDGGEVRWDKPCWHTLPEVRLSAACDAIVLENLVYQVVRQQFKGNPCYEELLDVCMDLGTLTKTVSEIRYAKMRSALAYRANLKSWQNWGDKATLGTFLGQNDDTHIARPGKAMQDDFTLSRYEMANRLKTAMMGFYSPVVMALLATGVRSKDAYRPALDISVDLSVILQIQDDFNDCFGEEKIEVSNDIRRGCCTWMMLEAKKTANAQQLQILKDNYGYDDEAKVAAVKVIYEELRLKEKLLDYRRQKYDSVEVKIQDNAHLIPPNIYRYAVEVMQDMSVEWFSRNTVI